MEWRERWTREILIFSPKWGDFCKSLSMKRGSSRDWGFLRFSGTRCWSTNISPGFGDLISGFYRDLELAPNPENLAPNIRDVDKNSSHLLQQERVSPSFCGISRPSLMFGAHGALNVILKAHFVFYINIFTIFPSLFLFFSLSPQPLYIPYVYPIIQLYLPYYLYPYYVFYPSYPYLSFSFSLYSIYLSIMVIYVITKYFLHIIIHKL